jgi:hypothetical protein
MSDFRSDLLSRQEQILARWQAQDLYHAILEDRYDAQPLIIHDGLPYMSGQVHVGIGLKKILKDVAAKFHSMCDRRSSSAGSRRETLALLSSSPSSAEVATARVRVGTQRIVERAVRQRHRSANRFRAMPLMDTCAFADLLVS